MKPTKFRGPGETVTLWALCDVKPFFMLSDNAQHMLITFIMYPVMQFAYAYQSHSQ